MDRTYGYALVVPKSDNLEGDLNAALRHCGLRASDLNQGGLRLYQWVSDAHLVLFLEGHEGRLERLPRALAEATQMELTLFELELEETGPNDDDELKSSFSKSVVSPSGDVREVETADEQLERGGELLEDLGNALHWYVEADVPGMNRKQGLGPMYLEPVNKTLPPRLQQLASDITIAGSWAVEAQGTRWLVRVALPDGTKRISIVTQEELKRLEASTEPTPSQSA